jgi:ribosomal protein S12 methylthiotransferase accessory factor
VNQEIAVTFPGNLQVAASVGDFMVLTDQPETSGGDHEAPSPSDLFLASIANCAGYFALKFCQAREIDTSTMRLSMSYAWDDEQKRWPKLSIELHLPDDFPARYQKAIIKAMDQCVVKKHILQPPEFEITTV